MNELQKNSLRTEEDKNGYKQTTLTTSYENLQNKWDTPPEANKRL